MSRKTEFLEKRVVFAPKKGKTVERNPSGRSGDTEDFQQGQTEWRVWERTTHEEKSWFIHSLLISTLTSTHLT